jgi:hypothetical protein
VTEQDRETIIDSLRSDHRAITELLTSPAIADTTEEALAARERLVMSLVRHFVAEEQYLYPTVLDLDDGPASAKAEHQLAADRELENHLRALEEPQLTPALMADVLSRVRTDFAAHVAAQEELFGVVAQRCSPDTLAELGADVRGAEQLAPTRPRRIVPRAETANKIVSFVEGFLDHARDYYRHRGVDTDASNPEDL